MAEWSIAADSKSVVPVRVPGVRIPLSPPLLPAGRGYQLSVSVRVWLPVHTPVLQIPDWFGAIEPLME